MKYIYTLLSFLFLTNCAAFPEWLQCDSLGIQNKNECDYHFALIEWEKQMNESVKDVGAPVGGYSNGGGNYTNTPCCYNTLNNSSRDYIYVKKYRAPKGPIK